MTDLHAYLDGIGLLGPGFDSWAEAQPILSGRQPYAGRTTVVPPPTALPAAERRRAGTVVKIALAAAGEAIAQAGANPADLASVFASSGADGDNCHAICEALASEDRLISPTRFHNSVHNAAAGYWSIAAKAMEPSSVICAFDASFSAGLIEAMTLVAVDRRRCLLVAYEAPYPEPLNASRPLPDAFAMALLLSPHPSPKSLARLSADLGDHSVALLTDPGLEHLRRSIPSARSLPLLAALARGGAERVVLEYLAPLHVSVQVAPC
jgi:hypothetical protein